MIMSDVDSTMPHAASLAETDRTAQGNTAGDKMKLSNDTSKNDVECSLEHNFATPVDSIYYFQSPDGQLITLEGTTAKVGTRVIFECTDSKSKSAYRECQPNGGWSLQNKAIVCDKWRYWAAVIAAATSAFIILILLVYFTCSAYNKRKKRKYIARTERVREQDEMMMRNENFVRLNFRPLPLSLHPDASGSTAESTTTPAPDASAPVIEDIQNNDTETSPGDS